MRIIYFRHGPDCAKSDATWTQDCLLASDARSEIEKFVRKIVRKYGMPNEIRYSPMRRTIQTKDECLRVLAKIDRKVKIKEKLDRNLSRFFTAKERLDLNVAPETRAIGFPLIPCEVSKENVRKSLRRLCKKARNHPEKVIWCITHAVVLKEIRKAINNEELYPSDKRQPFLYYIKYDV